MKTMNIFFVSILLIGCSFLIKDDNLMFEANRFGIILVVYGLFTSMEFPLKEAK